MVQVWKFKGLKKRAVFFFSEILLVRAHYRPFVSKIKNKLTYKKIKNHLSPH